MTQRSLGQIFYDEATAPARTMHLHLQGSDVGAALNAVSAAALSFALNAGIGRVQRETGVERDAVRLLLPEIEVQAALQAVTESQGRAVQVWNQHAGGIASMAGGVIDALLEIKFGIGSFGLGAQAAAMANSGLKDARLGGPIAELQTALAAYDEWLRWAGTTLNEDVALAEAYARAWKRARHLRLMRQSATVVGALAGLCVLGVGGRWLFAQQTQAAEVPSSVAPDAALAEPPPSATASTSVSVTKPASRTPSRRAVPSASTMGPASSTSAPTMSSTSPPPTTNPAARAGCLHACIDKCKDDANCERGCASACPR